MNEQSPSYKSDMWNDKLQTNISNSSATLFYIGYVVMISLSSVVRHCYGTMEKVNLHMLVTSSDLIHLLAQFVVLSLNLFMMDVLLSLLKLTYNSALKSNWCNWKYYKFHPLPVWIHYFNIIASVLICFSLSPVA